jgi:hypothetical protein
MRTFTCRSTFLYVDKPLDMGVRKELYKPLDMGIRKKLNKQYFCTSIYYGKLGKVAHSDKKLCGVGWGLGGPPPSRTVINLASSKADLC